MVKLYYLAIIKKHDEKSDILFESSNLSDFGFFRRTSVEEFMRFSCLFMADRTDPGVKVSVREQMYFCHVFVRHHDLAAAAVTDDEYSHIVAHRCLQDLLNDYICNPSSSYTGVKVFMAKYNKPTIPNQLDAIRRDLEETTIILHKTMEALLKRGENLDDLVAKTDVLSIQAKTFHKTARKTNSCCHRSF